MPSIQNHTTFLFFPPLPQEIAFTQGLRLVNLTAFKNPGLPKPAFLRETNDQEVLDKALFLGGVVRWGGVG